MNFTEHDGFYWPGDGGVAIEIYANDKEVLKTLVLTLPAQVIFSLDELAQWSKHVHVREAERILNSASTL